MTNNKGGEYMLWGTFSALHIASILFIPVVVAGGYFLLKDKGEKVQTAVLGVLSFSGIGAIVFNLLAWNSPLEYLPLHIYSINALLLPFLVFRPNHVLGNLLSLWSLGALVAIVVNFAQANFNVFSWTFFFYYFPHVLEFAIPLWMILLGKVRLDKKYLFSTLGLTMAIYTAVHFSNLLINAGGFTDGAGNLIQVNYNVVILKQHNHHYHKR